MYERGKSPASYKTRVQRSIKGITKAQFLDIYRLMLSALTYVYTRIKPGNALNQPKPEQVVRQQMLSFSIHRMSKDPSYDAKGGICLITATFSHATLYFAVTQAWRTCKSVDSEIEAFRMIWGPNYDGACV